MVVDVRELRALIARAAEGLSGPASLDGPLDQAEQAVRIAEAADEPALLLDALEVRAQVLTGMGQVTAADWLAVEEAARTCDAWARAAAALRMQVMNLLDDQAAAAEAPAARLIELSSANGLSRDLAWAEAARAEIAFVAGRWDDAMMLAMRAVGSAGRAGDGNTTLRAWHIVIPIAAERGDTTRLSLASYPYAARAAYAPDTPYRRMLDAAAAIRFGAAGLADGKTPDSAVLLAAVEGAAAMPHWLTAVETVVERWIEIGEFAAAERALESMGASQGSGLGGSVAALLRARLLLAEGALKRGVAAQAWTALEGFSKVGAPWWVAKTVRVLGKAGEATPALRGQARKILAALGVA